MAVVVGVVEAVAGEIHVFFAGGDMFPAGGDVSEGDAGTYELGQFLGVERVDFRGGVVPFWVGRHRGDEDDGAFWEGGAYGLEHLAGKGGEFVGFAVTGGVVHAEGEEEEVGFLGDDVGYAGGSPLGVHAAFGEVGECELRAEFFFESADEERGVAGLIGRDVGDGGGVGFGADTVAEHDDFEGLFCVEFLAELAELLVGSELNGWDSPVVVALVGGGALQVVHEVTGTVEHPCAGVALGGVGVGRIGLGVECCGRGEGDAGFGGESEFAAAGLPCVVAP